MRGQADTAVPCGGEAPLPGRIHNTESRSMGAPLPPQPAVGCKTAAGKRFGSSSAVGITATAPHWAHHEQGTTADGGLWIRYAGNALGVFLHRLSWGWKFHCHFLELFIWGLKWTYERVHRHQHWATKWRKQMENGMSGSSLLAVAVVNCWSSTCLPLLLSFQLVGFTHSSGLCF